MERYKSLEVFLDGQRVGTLATMRDGRAAFEYAESWLAEGFAISPFSLPLVKKVFIPKFDPFDGLFGAFADSLPDGWGRLLVDRMLARQNETPSGVDSLNRLAIVGESGMGALSYRPTHELISREAQLDYDRIAEECRRVLLSDYSDDLDALFALGGSSGGARPKILTELDGEGWIVKFPASADAHEAGLREYRYSLCAKSCGIDMPETRLFASNRCAGYFGVKRFDRVRDSGGKARRIHMLTVSALLETSHRIPNLDYNDLMKLALELTRDYAQVEALYRQMCFNVFAHNRDDHSKNFSFIHDEAAKAWRLSPAYDLTYSNSIGGEHASCVNGNGKDPSMKDILVVADKIGIGRERAKRTAQAVRDTVMDELREYLEPAKF